MRRSSLIIALLILGSAAVWWGLGNHRLQEVRLQSRALQSELVEKQSALTEAGALVSRLRQDIAAAERSAEFSAVQTRKVVGQIAQFPPDRLYAKPPAQLPDWNPESPYVWLSKDQLRHWPVQPFAKSGALEPEVAHVLTLGPDDTRALNDRLQAIVRDFQAVEATHFEPIDEHLPGIAGQEGIPITVVAHPPVEAGQAAREKFAAEIRQALGEQRSELVLGNGQEWLNITFAQGGALSATYSILLRPNGTYNMAVKRGTSWMNTTMSDWKGLQYNLPPHLLPHFAPLKPTDR